jgi:apolipoprotein N-acyltransferase
MRYLRQFGRFWYDFVVGDDWRLAVGVVAIVAVVDVAANPGLDAWWLLPASVTALLWVSLRRATADRA